jgi:1-acyl-sn-glycerol-3-phosphate acyltransferase
MSPAANFIAGSARFLTGVQVARIGAAPEARQTIYFANHTSHLDFVVLWSALSKRERAVTRPVAAKDYWCQGLRRAVAVGAFNALLIERHAKCASGATSSDPKAAARATIDALVAGMGDAHSLIIFPEGTRGSGNAIAPFKSGLYHLCARKPDVRLVPVYMENLNRILPKGEIMPVPFIGRVTFGAPIAFDPTESKDRFLTRARAAVCELAQ